MKQGEFHALSGYETKRFYGGQFRFAIETLDDARRNRAAGRQPVEDHVVIGPSRGPGHRPEA